MQTSNLNPAAKWSKLVAEDARIGLPKNDKDARRLEALLPKIEQAEEQVLAEAAGGPDDVKLKLRILARAITGGADADRIVSIADRCRADLMKYPHVSI